MKDMKKEITLEMLIKVIEDGECANTADGVIAWIRVYQCGIWFKDLEMVHELYNKGYIAE